MEPRFNEVAGDRPNLFVKWRVRYIEVLFHPGGVLPYMGYIGMCGPKGYGFSAVLVINRVSIIAIFRHCGHK